MTSKKDLKKRVRARAAQLGENYTTALEKIRRGEATPPRRSLLEEWHRVDADAQAAGLSCAAVVTHALWTELRPPQDDSVRALLSALRRVLDVTASDPAFVLLRSALIRGQPVASHDLQLSTLLANRRAFGERLRAGLRGLSPEGCELAFELSQPGKSLLVVASLGRAFTGLRGRERSSVPAGTRWIPPNPCVYLSPGSAWMREAPSLEAALAT